MLFCFASLLSANIIQIHRNRLARCKNGIIVPQRPRTATCLTFQSHSSTEGQNTQTRARNPRNREEEDNCNQISARPRRGEQWDFRETLAENGALCIFVGGCDFSGLSSGGCTARKFQRTSTSNGIIAVDFLRCNYVCRFHSCFCGLRSEIQNFKALDKFVGREDHQKFWNARESKTCGYVFDLDVAKPRCRCLGRLCQDTARRRKAKQQLVLSAKNFKKGCTRALHHRFDIV